MPSAGEALARGEADARTNGSYCCSSARGGIGDMTARKIKADEENLIKKILLRCGKTGENDTGAFFRVLFDE